MNHTCDPHHKSIRFAFVFPELHPSDKFKRFKSKEPKNKSTVVSGFPVSYMWVSTRQRQIRTDNYYLIPLSKPFGTMWGAECPYQWSALALRPPKMWVSSPETLWTAGASGRRCSWMSRSARRLVRMRWIWSWLLSLRSVAGSGVSCAWPLKLTSISPCSQFCGQICASGWVRPPVWWLSGFPFSQVAKLV